MLYEINVLWVLNQIWNEMLFELFHEMLYEHYTNVEWNVEHNLIQIVVWNVVKN